ncbi:MAG: CBS domain-containing protein [Nanoarchaeota archaeon]
MKNILVADVMTREVVTVPPSANLFDCAKTMVKKNVTSVIIADRQKLVGFISQTDILWAITKKASIDLSKIRAIDISPKKIAVISPKNTIKEVIAKMNTLKFERLPVVHENKLVGVITAKDVLNVHPEVYPELEEFARIREESEKLGRVKKADIKIREGICEECGHEGILFRMNGMLVCESCKDEV